MEKVIRKTCGTVGELIDELSKFDRNKTLWTVHDCGFGALFDSVDFCVATANIVKENHKIHHLEGMEIGDLLFDNGDGVFGDSDVDDD